MSVVLVPYDAGWPEMFERERLAILSEMREVDVDLEHIGSTSVPGYVARLTKLRSSSAVPRTPRSCNVRR
jgi:GrpB-like predicted nucleotidyltransferase (UPF0157 family)